MSLVIERPDIKNAAFGQILSHDGLMAFSGEYTNNELQIVDEIISTASEVLVQECKDNNKTGFMLCVAFTNKSPIVVQIGEINSEDEKYGADGKKLKYADFARSKAIVLQSNSQFSRSSENSKLKNKFKTQIHKEEVVGGAVAFDNWYIISISGLSSIAVDDENAVLKVGKALGFKEATSSNF